jgi:hypothetical protein
MAAGKGSEFSSPFDAMLARNRDRLDRLHDGAAGDRYRPAATSDRATPSRPDSGPARPPLPAGRAPSGPRRILDERFGDRWRHEIVERRRDGADMVVRCRLIVADHGIDVAGSGRARIEAISARHETIGSADGIPFSFRSDDAPGGGEDDAVERASVDALAKCVEAI